MPFLFEFVFGSGLLICAGCLFVAVIRSLQDQRFFRKAVPLTSTICSFFWIELAFAWRGALGPDYSIVRYTIIGANMFAMAVAAIAAAVIRSQRSWPTVPAAFILALFWFYIGAINSVAG
jgi:hypothetical protein